MGFVKSHERAQQLRFLSVLCPVSIRKSPAFLVRAAVPVNAPAEAALAQRAPKDVRDEGQRKFVVVVHPGRNLYTGGKGLQHERLCVQNRTLGNLRQPLHKLRERFNKRMGFLFHREKIPEVHLAKKGQLCDLRK